MVGLSVMILGLVLFPGVHVLTTQRDLRAQLIAMAGESVYKIVYSLASVAGLALIVWGFADYRSTGWIDVWEHWLSPGTLKILKHIAVALMLPAVILVVASYIRGRIYTTLKHPMLAGVKLWAAAHLIANGDLGSIILFGSFLTWAVFDRISLKRRADPGRRPRQRPDRGRGWYCRLCRACLRVSSRRDRRSRGRCLIRSVPTDAGWLSVLANGSVKRSACEGASAVGPGSV